MHLQLLEASTLKLLEGGIQEVAVSPAPTPKQICMDAVFHITTMQRKTSTVGETLFASLPADCRHHSSLQGL